MIFLAAFTLLPVSLCAQPKSIGAYFSFHETAVCYEHGVDDDNSFMEIALRAECSELYIGRARYPGVSASATWNIVIGKWQSSEGSAVSLFAGPGAILGYARDFNTPYGLFFGIRGKIGVEYRFIRNICLSASISPSLCSHIRSEDGHRSMRYYRNGLIYGLVPGVGIKYIF